MPTQHSGIDFVAYDRDGQVVLLAEAKSKRRTTEDWAAGLRRNMLSHGILPWAKYFLIATPDRMYLWKQTRANPGDVPPEFFAIDARQVLQPYFEKFHQTPSEIGPEAFEFLVLTWLTDIARSAERELEQNPSVAWLSELSGSLRQARIEMNPE